MLRKLKITLPPIQTQNKLEEIHKNTEIQLQCLNRSLELLEEILRAVIYITFDPNKPIQLDEIELLLNDEIALELFLNTLNSKDFQSKELYSAEIEKLFKILEATEKKNIEDETHKKGIIQRIQNRKIILESNRDYKNRLIDETVKN